MPSPRAAGESREASRLSETELSELEVRIRDEQARDYDVRYDTAYTPWLTDVQFRVLRLILDPRPHDVLLDFGCGTGRLATRFAPICRRVIAIDRSKTSLEVLRQRLRGQNIQNVEVAEADITRPVRIGSKPTKAISVEVLQHVPSRSKRRQAVRTAFDLLAAGGRCVFINETYGLVRWLHGEPREIAQPGRVFFHTYKSRELREDLEAAGFRRVRVTGGGVLYWTRYRFAPAMTARLDPLFSLMPGAGAVARFLVAVGDRPQA